jgi:hypothetical protein
MASLLAAGGFRATGTRREGCVRTLAGERRGKKSGSWRNVVHNNGNIVTVSYNYKLHPVTGCCWCHLPVVRLSSILPSFLRVRGVHPTRPHNESLNTRVRNQTFYFGSIAACCLHFCITNKEFSSYLVSMLVSLLNLFHKKLKYYGGSSSTNGIASYVIGKYKKIMIWKKSETKPRNLMYELNHVLNWVHHTSCHHSPRLSW